MMGDAMEMEFAEFEGDRRRMEVPRRAVPRALDAGRGELRRASIEISLKAVVNSDVSLSFPLLETDEAWSTKLGPELGVFEQAKRAPTLKVVV